MVECQRIGTLPPSEPSSGARPVHHVAEPRRRGRARRGLRAWHSARCSQPPGSNRLSSNGGRRRGVGRCRCTPHPRAAIQPAMSLATPIAPTTSSPDLITTPPPNRRQRIRAKSVHVLVQRRPTDLGRLSRSDGAGEDVQRWRSDRSECCLRARYARARLGHNCYEAARDLLVAALPARRTGQIPFGITNPPARHRELTQAARPKRSRSTAQGHGRFWSLALALPMSTPRDSHRNDPRHRHHRGSRSPAIPRTARRTVGV